MKFFFSFCFLLFFCNKIFSQTDTLKREEIKFNPSSSEAKNIKRDEQDSLPPKIKKHSNYISVLPIRFFFGEFAVFYETIKKQRRGYEIGIGYIIPSRDNFSPFFSTWETADHLLYGFSFYYSQKYYGNNHPLSYISPEIILRYEYNDNISVYKDYGVVSHVSQQRISPSFSVKFGWRDKRGISDFYLGFGAKVRYVNTQYLDPPNPNAMGYYQIEQAYGWYAFPVIRIGLKVGFPF